VLLRLTVAAWTRRPLRRWTGVAAVALGTAVAVGLLAVVLGAGDRLQRELRALGANLVLVPAGQALPLTVGERSMAPPRRLDDRDLAEMGRVFWRHNILSFAPLLPLEASVAGRPTVLVGTWVERPFPHGGGRTTGLRAMRSGLSLEGRWPLDAAGDEALAGCNLRLRVGEVVEVRVRDARRRVRVVGVSRSGDEADGRLLLPLETVQALAAEPHAVASVEVSALVTPEPAVALDPASLGGPEFERWYCTPYVSSVARQLEQAVPGSACRVVRRVAAGEGAVLERVSWLLGGITLLALTAAILGVASAVSEAVVERRAEIGLWKALGCQDHGVMGLLLAESAAMAALGAALGLPGGTAVAWAAERLVLEGDLALQPWTLVLAPLVALGVAWAGTLLAAVGVLRLSPGEALRT